MAFIDDLISKLNTLRTTIGTKLNLLKAQIGILPNLTTANKNSLVEAINEVNSSSIPTNYITTNTTQTGLTGNKTTSGTWTFNSQINTANHGNSSQWRYGDYGLGKFVVLGNVGANGLDTTANNTGFYLATGVDTNIVGNVTVKLIQLGNPSQTALVSQIAMAHSGGVNPAAQRLAYRSSQTSPWVELFHSGNLTTATSTVSGIVKLGSDTVQTATTAALASTASRSYLIQVNSSGQMVVNVPWTNTDTVTQIGANGSNYTFGNINFINGQDIQISKSGNTVRIDYVGTSGDGGPTKIISLTTDNLDDSTLNNGFIHKGSYAYIDSEAYDQTGLVLFAVRTSNGEWASPSNYAREFYGKMGVRFNDVQDYTTQGTILYPNGFSNDLYALWEDRKYYLVAYYDIDSDEFFHGWADWYQILDLRKKCYGGTGMMCILGKLIKDSNDKFSIDVDPKYF